MVAKKHTYTYTSPKSEDRKYVHVLHSFNQKSNKRLLHTPEAWSFAENATNLLTCDVHTYIASSLNGVKHRGTSVDWCL